MSRLDTRLWHGPSNLLAWAIGPLMRRISGPSDPDDHADTAEPRTLFSAALEHFSHMANWGIFLALGATVVLFIPLVVEVALGIVEQNPVSGPAATFLLVVCIPMIAWHLLASFAAFGCHIIPGANTSRWLVPLLSPGWPDTVPFALAIWLYLTQFA